MNPSLLMRHVVHDAAGGDAASMRIETAPMPIPAPGELLIAVEAAGVNRPDLMQRAGRYPPPPGASPTLGLEVAGTVLAIGPTLPGPTLPDPTLPGDATPTGPAFRIGDRVCALVNGGGYATRCVAPVGQCLPWPAGFDAVRAAALPETCFTVWSNLFRTGRLSAGETILVHGGTSGIGSIAIQLARGLGARAFSTSGSAEKCATSLSLGAEAAIDYRREDFVARIKTLTGDRGVDVVLDIMGASYLGRNLDCLADLGRLVLVSLQGGAVADQVSLTRIMTGRLTLTGTTLRPRSAAYKAEIAEALLQNVWPMLDAGSVAPLMHKVYPFEQVADAHREMESGDHAGKIVLRMPEPEHAA